MKTRKDMYKNANMKQKKMKTKMKDKINKGKKKVRTKDHFGNVPSKIL